jgi:hypothetical protein
MSDAKDLKNENKNNQNLSWRNATPKPAGFHLDLAESGEVADLDRAYDSTHYRVGEVQLVDQEYVGYFFRCLFASVRLVLREVFVLSKIPSPLVRPLRKKTKWDFRVEFRGAILLLVPLSDCGPR